MKLIQLHMYQGSPIFRALSCSLHQHSSVGELQQRNDGELHSPSKYRLMMFCECFTMFASVLQCLQVFHNVCKCFTIFCRCFTIFCACFTMFYEWFMLFYECFTMFNNLLGVAWQLAVAASASAPSPIATSVTMQLPIAAGNGTVITQLKWSHAKLCLEWSLE